MEVLQANARYAHVRYRGRGESTVATKHLAPNGHNEVLETLPATDHIPKEAENLPLDTHVSVTLDAELFSTPEPKPQPDHTPAPLRRL